MRIKLYKNIVLLFWCAFAINIKAEDGFEEKKREIVSWPMNSSSGKKGKFLMCVEFPVVGKTIFAQHLPVYISEMPHSIARSEIYTADEVLRGICYKFSYRQEFETGKKYCFRLVLKLISHFASRSKLQDEYYEIELIFKKFDCNYKSVSLFKENSVLNAELEGGIKKLLGLVSQEKIKLFGVFRIRLLFELCGFDESVAKEALDWYEVVRGEICFIEDIIRYFKNYAEIEKYYTNKELIIKQLKCSIFNCQEYLSMFTESMANELEYYIKQVLDDLKELEESMNYFFLKKEISKFRLSLEEECKENMFSIFSSANDFFTEKKRMLIRKEAESMIENICLKAEKKIWSMIKEGNYSEQNKEDLLREFFDEGVVDLWKLIVLGE